MTKKKFSAKKFRQLQIALNCFVRGYDNDDDRHYRAASSEAYDVLQEAPKMTAEECREYCEWWQSSGYGIRATAWSIAASVIAGYGKHTRYYKLGLLDRAERKHRKRFPHYWDDTDWTQWLYRSRRDFDSKYHTIRTRPVVKSLIRTLGLK